MILFENVTKRFGKVKVLDGVNLTINPGEFVSVVGPSGAGKSTLVYVLIGAENIQKGKISVDGYVVNEMKAKALQYFRRKVGVVFQDYKLLSQKNVYENVAFAMEVCGYEKAEIKARVPEVLEITGLKEKAKQFPHQLSGGEKQRTAIARALVHNPKLIVADEPTGNLDPKTAKEIVALLLKINADGTTVILTTHNKPLVDAIKRRVITLGEGKIVSDKNVSGYD
jgi:cell division transport system ATP-binding protein